MHAYAEQGSYTIQVIVYNDDGTVAGSVSGPVTVTGTSTPPTPSQITLTPATGLTLIDVWPFVDNNPFPILATFTDSDPAANSAIFRALVDWGDGHIIDGGVLSYITATSQFCIRGYYNYGSPGTESATVYLYKNDGDGQTVPLTTTVTITDPMSITPLPLAIDDLQQRRLRRGGAVHGERSGGRFRRLFRLAQPARFKLLRGPRS